MLFKIVHGTYQPGIILQGSGFQFQSLGKSGHDAGAYFFGQRVDQQLLLGADAAADQDQLRVEDVNRARERLPQVPATTPRRLSIWPVAVYADAGQRRGIVGGDKVPDGGGDGVQNRRFVAVGG